MKEFVFVPLSLCALAFAASVAQAEPLGKTHLWTRCTLSRPGPELIEVTITTMDGLPGTFIAVYENTVMGSRLDIANFRVTKTNNSLSGSFSYLDQNTDGKMVQLDLDPANSSERSGHQKGTLHLGNGAAPIILENMDCQS